MRKIKEVLTKRYQVSDGDHFLGEYPSKHEAMVKLVTFRMGVVGQSQYDTVIGKLLNSPQALEILKEYTE